MFSILKGALGEVHSVNEKDYTVKVKLLEYEGVITEDLQVTTLLSFGKTIYSLPDVNTPVIVIFFDDDTDRGFVIAGFYSMKNKAEGTKDKIIFDCEGNYISIDRKTKSISIISKEKIVISSPEIVHNCNSYTVNAKEINLNADKTTIKSKIIDALGSIKSSMIMYAKDFIKT